MGGGGGKHEWAGWVCTCAKWRISVRVCALGTGLGAMAASATSAAGAPSPDKHATSTSMLTGETNSGCACAGEQNVNKEGPRGGTENKTRARVGGRPQGVRLVWASALLATHPDARGGRGWGGEGVCAWVECESLRGRVGTCIIFK